ncbi:MAG TPA: DUF2231 domain-containing protein [Gaiellaceae bacterium]|nr:DUF2231 domain-containing protein [Gaiellaceae bacterium]
MAEFKPTYLVRGLPGHPLHPPLTDATIGAYTFATVAAILSEAGVAEHGFAQAWWLGLVVALVSTVLTAAAGLLDWLTITWGSELWKTATAHALANVTAGVLFLLAAVFGHGGYVDRSVTTGGFVLTLLGFVVLAVGGWLGGAITYVHGMRVLSLVDEPAAKAAAPVPSDEKVAAAKG